MCQCPNQGHDDHWAVWSSAAITEPVDVQSKGTAITEPYHQMQYHQAHITGWGLHRALSLSIHRSLAAGCLSLYASCCSNWQFKATTRVSLGPRKDSGEVEVRRSGGLSASSPQLCRFPQRPQFHIIVQVLVLRWRYIVGLGEIRWIVWSITPAPWNSSMSSDLLFNFQDQTIMHTICLSKWAVSIRFLTILLPSWCLSEQASSIKGPDDYSTSPSYCGVCWHI
jgi:hypothetical protein